jgi:hypothetical protein
MSVKADTTPADDHRWRFQAELEEVYRGHNDTKIQYWINLVRLSEAGTANYSGVATP